MKILEQKIEYDMELSSLEDLALGEGKRCIITRIEARKVLICSDEEEFIVAYPAKMLKAYMTT